MSKHMWETKSSTDSRSRSNRFLKNRNDSTADWLKASRLFKNKVTELAAAAAAVMRIKSTLQKGLTGTERQSQPNRRENKTSALFMLLPSMMRLLLHGWQTSRAANQLEKGFTAALERNQTRDQIRYDISRPQGRCLTESREKHEASRTRANDRWDSHGGRSNPARIQSTARTNRVTHRSRAKQIQRKREEAGSG
jgi:hypothetical protein